MPGISKKARLAQETVYEIALAILQEKEKTSKWMKIKKIKL